MSKPMYLEQYPHLFQPLTVGKKKLVYKNRIMVGPMQVSGAYSTDANGTINDYGVDYYTDLARGGFAPARFPWKSPVIARTSAPFVLMKSPRALHLCTFCNVRFMLSA